MFPPSCILCGKAGFEGMDVCQHCFDELPRNNWYCSVCGQAYNAQVNHLQICGRCSQEKPAFDQVFAPYRYHAPMSYLVSALKFGAQYKNARLLAMLLTQAMSDQDLRPQCFIPVPLHAARYRQRGFNQSLEITKQLSSIHNIELQAHVCKRVKNTPQQSHLNAKQRKKNLINAFSVEPVEFRHIALVDDVMTTGSTVNALAKAFKKTGVERVDVWVCARA